jgi:DMSO/TMAO reductase YedYZ heme-binding membrane subunit
MSFIRKHLLATLLIAAFIIATILWIVAAKLYPGSMTLQSIRLMQWYALTAVTYLYLAIIIEPLGFLFGFTENPLAITLRKVFVVSALFFGLSHVRLAFFDQLGGFAGLGFLNARYLTILSLGLITLIILSILTILMLPKVIERIGTKRWWILSRLVYITGILILIHAFMLGTHFVDISAEIPQLFLVAAGLIILLEALRLDAVLRKRFTYLPRFGVATTLIIALIISYFLWSFLPGSALPSLSVHAQHIQQAQQMAQGTTPDQTRYSVNVIQPSYINPNEEVTLSFKVFNAANGNQVVLFNKVYGKIIHLIIVDSSLTYFDHIHPEFDNGVFTITTRFPKAGSYHLYADFQPLGSTEQQVASSLGVGKITAGPRPAFSPDTQLTKTFGKYEVTLTKPNPLTASELSVGKQILSFTMRDATTHEPITNLKPYLESFGHLVMINTETFDYIHVHPASLTVPAPDANGGPTVEFMPLGLNGPIQPGIYRVFAQFNPDNHLFVADYTIEIK